jgi:DNA-binding XRE family transcriptional regulator
MPNHPNRSGNGKARNPKPAEIKAARIKAGLSQAAAGELIYITQQAWNLYETEFGTTSSGGNSTHRRMHPAFWDLFQRKVKEMNE